MRLRIKSRYLSNKSINELCDEFHICLSVNDIDDNADKTHQKRKLRSNKKTTLGDTNGVKITLNLYEQHYFIEEKTPLTSYYVNHFETLTNEDCNKRMFGNKLKQTKESKDYITSSNLIRYLLQHNYFTPITYGQSFILNTIFHHDINHDLEDVNLDYNEKYCLKKIAPKTFTAKPSKIPPTYWFADFEADTSGDIHKPYMCVLQKDDYKVNKEYRGEDCANKLLEFLPDNANVYFHNLAYDIRMLPQFTFTNTIIKGSKMMKADIKYKGKTIHFKDSLAIIQAPLREFPKMFNIPSIQKEIFPYNYYTLDRLKSNLGIISEAGLNEAKPWNDADYKLFNENIDKIPNCRIDAEHFDMWKYASFYCQQDVNILRIGFTQLREGFMKDFNIDAYNFISISSLANEVFNKHVYYQNVN